MEGKKERDGKKTWDEDMIIIVLSLSLC